MRDGPESAGGAAISSSRDVSPASWTARLGELTCLVCACASVLTTAGLVVVLLFEATRFFGEVSPLAFFADHVWAPTAPEPRFGVWPLVVGTVLTTAIAVLVALPMGLLSAIYLSELSPRRVRRWVKPALEVLAGVPTIVYGYFALVLVTPALQRVVPGLESFNALSPGLVIGIMMLPMVSARCEDAIHAVPMALRQASYGLGVGRVSTILRVVVPAAAPGIAAAVFLALSRVIGETIVVTLAAGHQPTTTLDPRGPIETLTTWIADVGPGSASASPVAYRALFAVALVLVLVTFVTNLVSQRLARRYARAWE